MSDQLLNQFVANFKAKFPEEIQPETSSEGQQVASTTTLSSTESQHTNTIETNNEPVEKVGFFRRILNWILSKMFSS